MEFTDSLLCFLISAIGDDEVGGLTFSVSSSFSCESIDSRLGRKESKEPDRNCEL
jgi:hypothetical protein